MTLKIAKVFIVIFTVFLFLGAVYIGIRNISYFDIHEIELSFVGPVSNSSPDVERIVGPLKGLNIFEVNSNQLRNQLQSFGGVESVYIERIFPGKLKITVNFFDYKVRLFCQTEDNIKYYLADKNIFQEIDKSTFDFYAPLLAVEIDKSCASMLEKWGINTGFSQMVELADILFNNTLINYAKYVNNNVNDFGCFFLNLPAVHAELSVQDPVKQDRLLEVINIVIKNYEDTSVVHEYDLYSNALIKRN